VAFAVLAIFAFVAVVVALPASAASANITGTVSVSDTCNTESSTLFGNGTSYASGQAFPLITNGVAVTDPSLPSNKGILVAKRGNGSITFSINSHMTPGRQGVQGTVTIKGATITSVSEGFGKEGRLEDGPRDRAVCRLLGDYARKTSSNTVDFKIAAGPQTDTFTIRYAVSAVVVPTPTPTPTSTPTSTSLVTPSPAPVTKITCLKDGKEVIITTSNVNINCNNINNVVNVNVDNSSNNSSNNSSENNNTVVVNQKKVVVKKPVSKPIPKTIVPVAVPVTAKTGVEGVAAVIAVTALGGSGVVYLVRKSMTGQRKK